MLWIGFVVMAVVIQICAAAVLYSLYQTQREKLRVQLDYNLSTSVRQLTQWAFPHQTFAREVVKTSELSSLLMSVLPMTRIDAQRLASNPALQTFNRSQSEHLKDHGYSGFDLFRISDGRVLASSEIEGLAERHPVSDETALMTEITSGKVRFSPPMTILRALPHAPQDHRGLPVRMYVLIPLYADGDQPVAVLAPWLAAPMSLTTTLEHSRFGATGDTLAIDTEGRVLTRMRNEATLEQYGIRREGGLHGEYFVLRMRLGDDNAVDNWEARSPRNGAFIQPVGDLTKKRSGMSLDGYRGSRNTYNVGAWRWMDDIGIGLLVRQDYDEAYAEYIEGRRGILLFAYSTILAVGVLAWLITRRQYQDTRNELEKLLYQFADGVIIIDRSGRIHGANAAAEQMFGYEAGELNGRNVRVLLPEDLREQHDTWLAKSELHSGRVISRVRELKGIRKDSHQITIELNVSQVELNTGEFFVGNIRNISERIDQTRAILEAYEAADQANAAKSRFLARMSHELRTPLNGIIGMAEMLTRQLTQERNRRSAQVILDSGRTLLTLLNDILDLSKIEAGHMTLEPTPVDLRRICEDVVQLMRNRADEKGLYLQIAIDGGIQTRVITDGLRMRQVLLNLVGNAIKFTERGNVTLRISVDSPANCIGPSDSSGNIELFTEGSDTVADESTVVCLKIAVEDTGAGIAPEDQVRIFEEYGQSRQSDKNRAMSTGLGLPICSHLVTLMGGQLQVSSEPGRGSSFHFSACFPIAPAADVPEAHANLGSQLMPLPYPASILVVDDHPINRELMGEQLCELGCQVIFAENGQDALEQIARHPRLDLVFMDCNMPVLDGYAATRQLRELEASGDQHMTVIALTAHAAQSDREACIAAGMDDFMTKPAQLVELSQMLYKHLHGRQQTTPMASAGLASTRTDMAEAPHVSQMPIPTTSPAPSPVTLAPILAAAVTSTPEPASSTPPAVVVTASPLPVVHTFVDTTNEPEATHILAVDKLASRFRNDQALVERMLRRFSDHHVQDMVALVNAYESQDRNQLRSHAHRMRGAALMVSAEQLAADCTRLEEGIENGMTEADIEPMYAAILESSFGVQQRIAAVLATHEETVTPN